jgi:hypothetical protein
MKFRLGVHHFIFVPFFGRRALHHASVDIHGPNTMMETLRPQGTAEVVSCPILARVRACGGRVIFDSQRYVSHVVVMRPSSTLRASAALLKHSLQLPAQSDL